MVLAGVLSAGAASAQFFAPANRDAPPPEPAAPQFEVQDLAPPEDVGTAGRTATPPAKPRVRTARFPRLGPVPMPRPWGDRDAFTPDPAELALAQSQNGDVPSVPSASVEVTGVSAEPAEPVEVAKASQPPAVEPSVQAESQQGPAGTPPVDAIAAAPLPEPPKSLDVATPPAPEPPSEPAPSLAPRNNQVAALEPAPMVHSPELSPTTQRPETPNESVAPEARTGRDAYSLVLVVRPDVSDVSDLRGRRIALRGVTARDADVSLAVRSAIQGPFIAVPGTRDSDIKRLIQGEVDAIVVGLGPTLSEEDVKSASVGSFRALQVPLRMHP
ncbi:MAG: hypothetical protein JWL93_696 [Hyphomicrobiales bacterium]|nr:hypothetical protein [Hyphomicrobiales bacterium]